MPQINAPTVTLTLAEASALASFLGSGQVFAPYIHNLREAGTKYGTDYSTQADLLIGIMDTMQKLRCLSFQPQ